MADKPSYLLVNTDVLPEIFPKVVEAKRLLKTGKCKTASEAAEKLKISRSAFYKYKDSVFMLDEVGKGEIVTLYFETVDVPGVLSGILKILAAAQASVLTINQSIPVNQIANIIISLRTSALTRSVDVLLKKLGQLEGVNKVEMIAGE